MTDKICTWEISSLWLTLNQNSYGTNEKNSKIMVLDSISVSPTHVVALNFIPKSVITEL